MEFEGVVYKILPLTQGTSARGEWQRQDVVFELPSEFSRKICVTFFNKPSDVAKLREGATYTVSLGCRRHARTSVYQRPLYSRDSTFTETV